MRDSKGKEFPVWVRYIEQIAALGSLDAKSGSISAPVPFALYCPADAVVTLKLIDSDADITITLLAGYHPLAVESVTTTDVVIWACFAYKV